jgi:ABC-type amino acid transport substrate-binding protein
MLRTATLARHALVALAAAASLAAAAASPTLDRIKATGTLQLAYREGAEPFSFKDRDGRVRGYSVALCERVAESIRRSLGLARLSIQWRPVDAASRLETIASGQADLECGTTTITLSRMEKVDFSVMIYADGGSALVRRDAKIHRVTDLKGRRVAVIPGTTTEQALGHELSSHGLAATLVPVKDGDEGLAQLVAGKVDAYAGDRIVLTRLKQRSPKGTSLAFLAGDFSYEPYGLVMRRDDPEFRLAVNRALVGVFRSGEIDRIFLEWFGDLGKPGTLLHAMFYLQRLPE